jgi:6-methylsalicylate decarboxylase
VTDPTPVPLIDVHAHFLTDRYVEAAREAGHVHPDGMPGWPAWDAARHVELLDSWDIATALLSISSPGTHFGDDAAARTLSRHVNDAGAEIRRAHPGRFGHFASLPLPDVDGALTELERAVDELGCDGVTIETNAGGSYLGDPRFEPLFAELDRRRTPVFVHPTSPPHADVIALGRPRPMLEFLFDSARTVSDLVLTGALERHPGIPWIFTHGAEVLPLVAERMELFRQLLPAAEGPPDDPVPRQVGRLWFDMAGTPFPRQVPALAAAFGTERLLYGSDYCWTPAPATQTQLASIDAAPPPEGDSWRALTTRNARRLFPRLAR